MSTRASQPKPSAGGRIMLTEEQLDQTVGGMSLEKKITPTITQSGGDVAVVNATFQKVRASI